MKNKKITLAVWISVGIVAIGLVFLWYANFYIIRKSDRIFLPVDAPTSTMALVFGGGMKTPTEMSDMQYDRVEVGAQLYHAGKVQKVMITGDDGDFKIDEITGMINRLIELGVPESVIFTDPHGYRTYESCWREAKIYGITSTIVISQSFHLPRIQYLCEHFGIETIPVAADLRNYDGWLKNMVREWLARLKAFIQIEITQPLPRNLAK